MAGKEKWRQQKKNSIMYTVSLAEHNENVCSQQRRWREMCWRESWI